MRQEERAKSEEKESQNDAGREKAESAEGAGKVREAEEGGGVPRILFACVGNACRSPMAAGLARKILNAEAESAGIAPFGVCATKEALEVMRKFGVQSTWALNHIDFHPPVLAGATFPRSFSLSSPHESLLATSPATSHRTPLSGLIGLFSHRPPL